MRKTGMRKTGMLTFMLCAAAVVLLGAGFAAGVRVGPRWGHGAASGASSVGLDQVGPAPARAPLGRLPGTPTGEGAQAKLAVAATALSRVPQLRAEPPSPSESRKLTRLRFEELPPGVQKALDQVILGQPVQWKRLEVREREGARIYKAEYLTQGYEQEWDLDEQGKILASETDLPVAETPKPVLSGIERALPGAVVEDVERNQVTNSPSFYEVSVRHQGQRHEVHVGEDGQIIRQRMR